MKKTLTALFVSLFATFIGYSQPTELHWLDSPTTAQAQAKESKKGMLIEFTGSDWCGACQLQDKYGLSQKEIQAIITKHFIPIRFDLLQKNPMPQGRFEEIKNYEKKFNIRAYPSIVITDIEGRPVYFIYGFGTPEKLKNDLITGVKAYQDYKALREKIEKSKSPKTKAEHLASLLRKIPSDHLMSFYKADYEELLKIDPKDETCFKMEQEHQNLVKTQHHQLNSDLSANKKLFSSAETLNEALAFIDTYAQKDGLLPETHQELLLFKSRLLIKHKRPAEAKAPLEEAIKLQPNSPLTKTCKSLLKNLPFIIEKNSPTPALPPTPPSPPTTPQ